MMAARPALTDDERQTVLAVIHLGRTSARIRTRAQVLLKLAEQWPVEQICQAFEVSPGTVYNTLARYREGGVERVLHDGVQVNRRHALTSDEEALLLALTCSPVPDDHDHWTLRLLPNRLVELGVVERISPSTIHAVLKTMRSSRGSTNRGVSPNSTRPS